MPISSRFKQILEGRVLKELTVQANKTAEKAKQNANWSKDIPNAIGVGKAEKSQDGYKIDITIDLEKAPHAAAFEYGSGLHRTKGVPSLYPIEAENPLWKPLQFYWEKRGKWFVGAKLPYGHPGVEPKPYLQPAIESTRAGIVTSLAKVFKQAYLDSTVRVEVISAKK
jgi:hypothetical protein